MNRRYSHCLLLIGGLVLGVMLAPGVTQAQEAAVIHACYVPTTGLMYRIKEEGLSQACLTETHVEFRWGTGGLAGPRVGPGLQGPSGTAADGGAGVARNEGAAPALGAGAPLADSRMFWDTNKGAFRAGRVTGTQWDNSAVGGASVAMGFNTTAFGFAATAMGWGTSASQAHSTAMGLNTGAHGEGSTALGEQTIAEAKGSLVLGRYNQVGGDRHIWIPSDPLFTIGNGTDGNRNNAFEVLKNGNTTIDGDLTINNATINGTVQAPLHVLSSGGNPELKVEENTAGSAAQIELKNTARSWFVEADASPDQFVISKDGAFQDFVILGDGTVGIGTDSPADKLQVVGDVRVGTGTDGCVNDADGSLIAGTCSSDAQLKQHIAPLPSMLSSVTQLRPVYFNWRSDEFPERALGTETQLGLIAQEVERILPEMVVEGDDGFKRVRYSDLPLLLLQAIREQQQENENLRARVASLETTLQRLEAAVAGVQP